MKYMFRHAQTGERTYANLLHDAKSAARQVSRENSNVNIDIYRQTESGNYAPFIEVWGSQKGGKR